MFLTQYIPLRILSIYSIPQSTLDLGYNFFLKSSCWWSCCSLFDRAVGMEKYPSGASQSQESQISTHWPGFPFHLCIRSRPFQAQNATDYPWHIQAILTWKRIDKIMEWKQQQEHFHFQCMGWNGMSLGLEWWRNSRCCWERPRGIAQDLELFIEKWETS